MKTTTKSAGVPSLASCRLAPFLALWAVAGFAIAQPVDLYCEIEGSSFFEMMKQTHPSAGTLVYRIDPTRKQVTQTGGIFSDEPVVITHWSEVALEVEQFSKSFTAPPGIDAYRVTRMDRTTGRFAAEHEYRRGSRKLTQQELDRAHAEADALPHFRPVAGPAFGGKCAPRQKLF